MFGSLAKPREKPASSKELRGALERLKLTLEARERELSEAEAAYAGNPCEDLVAAHNRCKVARDVVKRDLAIKEAELAAAVERETDPRNRDRYDEAVRERAAVKKWLNARYEALAKELGEGIARLDAISKLSRIVNQNLPVGADELDDLEYSIRRTGIGYSGDLSEIVKLPALKHGELNHWPKDRVG